ncbi:hypothetical protein ACFWTE_11680 [Nocardiopsis sp. NPDC058631]|uniref:hypothetical protein n=1 Tax=Nocardiopsis sp. NPDC058631 TaxID=3346566 RepID=UPI00364B03E8
MREQIGAMLKASTLETREALLRGTRRKATPVRKAFVQAPRGAARREGPLAAFVIGRDRRGLLTYLFALALTSSHNDDSWATSRDSLVWARAIGFTEHASETTARASVWKAFGRLEERKLLGRSRKGRKGQSPTITATLLREDGSEEAYTRPGKDGDRSAYFQLPHWFWLEGYADRLALPGLAMLLVLLAGPSAGVKGLRMERMQEWYGFSADTTARGIKELEREGLVTVEKQRIKAPLAPLGWSEVNVYHVSSQFRLRDSTLGKEVKNEDGRHPAEEGQLPAQGRQQDRYCGENRSAPPVDLDWIGQTLEPR